MAVMLLVFLFWAAVVSLIVGCERVAVLCERALTAFDEPEFVLLTPSGPVVLVPVPAEFEGTLDEIFELPEGVARGW